MPDVLDPQNQNIIRTINYLGAVIIKEDNDIFYIDCYIQVDIKMSIPEISIVMTFPKKMKELFKGLLEYYNNQKKCYYNLGVISLVLNYKLFILYLKCF